MRRRNRDRSSFLPQSREDVAMVSENLRSCGSTVLMFVKGEVGPGFYRRAPAVAMNRGYREVLDGRGQDVIGFGCRSWHSPLLPEVNLIAVALPWHPCAVRDCGTNPASRLSFGAKRAHLACHQADTRAYCCFSRSIPFGCLLDMAFELELECVKTSAHICWSFSGKPSWPAQQEEIQELCHYDDSRTPL